MYKVINNQYGILSFITFNSENNKQCYEQTSKPDLIIWSIMHLYNRKRHHIIDENLCLKKFINFVCTILACTVV